MYITLADLFQFSLVIIGIVTLVYQITNKTAQPLKLTVLFLSI